MRDIGTVSDGTDIVTAYALVNGRRTVYIPVTKRADASTLSVVSQVKAHPGVPGAGAGRYHSQLRVRPVALRTAPLRAGARGGALGAPLTGLMVLLFLRDWRSAFDRRDQHSARAAGRGRRLWVTGQTINIMTLGGLALAVGMLVDEATVEIENIHTHLARGTVAAGGAGGLPRAAVPRLLAMLSVWRCSCRRSSWRRARAFSCRWRWRSVSPCRFVYLSSTWCRYCRCGGW